VVRLITSLPRAQPAPGSRSMWENEREKYMKFSDRKGLFGFPRVTSGAACVQRHLSQHVIQLRQWQPHDKICTRLGFLCVMLQLHWKGVALAQHTQGSGFKLQHCIKGRDG
jgi:hypothetical protein